MEGPANRLVQQHTSTHGKQEAVSNVHRWLPIAFIKLLKGIETTA